jgi:hypothetical protein
VAKQLWRATTGGGRTLSKPRRIVIEPGEPPVQPASPRGKYADCRPEAVLQPLALAR